MQPSEVRIPAYGEISADENAVGTDVADEDTFVQVAIFDTDGESLNTTPDHTSDDITIIIPGVYAIICTLDAQSNQSHDYHFGVFKDDTPIENISISRQTTVANKIGAVAMSGFARLDAEDAINLRVERRDGGAPSQTITIEHVTLSLNRISP